MNDMEIEGKLTIEHLEDNQVVEEFVLTNPMSAKGEDCVVDVDMGALSRNPFVVDFDQAIPPFQFEPAYNITFDNGDKRASIEFGGDKVIYSGDLPIDESAKLLFNAVFQRMQPRCKTCRWYDNGEENWRMCNCPKMLYGYRHPIDFPDDHVLIEDDEGWGMIPGPNFGCIHHEEKQ